MTWKRIRLELAREPEHPQGSADTCYHLEMPLDENGCVDIVLMLALPERARVRREAPGSPPKVGYILPMAGGWGFSYQPGEADDEPVFRLAGRRFLPGEYFTVTEAGGKAHAFRVAEVVPVVPTYSIV